MAARLNKGQGQRASLHLWFFRCSTYALMLDQITPASGVFGTLFK
jgi:hypothetical protein